MKEEKTTTKKKTLYYVLIGISVLLLAAAIVLTVYFTTGTPSDIAETPGDNQGTLPGEDETPGENEDPDDQEEPDEPTGGETEQYVLPVAAESCSVEHNAIYANASVGTYYRHTGVDFAADAGAEVYAMADGVVSRISLSEELGNLITITHDDGLESTYRFVEPVETLDVGDTVASGELIAHVAQAYGTEAHDGAHLHFEVTLDGEQTDPANYLDLVYEEK